MTSVSDLEVSPRDLPSGGARRGRVSSVFYCWISYFVSMMDSACLMILKTIPPGINLSSTDSTTATGTASFPSSSTFYYSVFVSSLVCSMVYVFSYSSTLLSTGRTFSDSTSSEFSPTSSSTADSSSYSFSSSSSSLSYLPMFSDSLVSFESLSSSWTK